MPPRGGGRSGRALSPRRPRSIDVKKKAKADLVRPAGSTPGRGVSPAGSSALTRRSAVPRGTLRAQNTGVIPRQAAQKRQSAAVKLGNRRISRRRR